MITLIDVQIFRFIGLSSRARCTSCHNLLHNKKTPFRTKSCINKTSPKILSIYMHVRLYVVYTLVVGENGNSSTAE